MTLREFYGRIDGNADEVIYRIGDEDSAKDILMMFPDDESFEQLQQSLGAHDYKTAFRAAHTLKGLSLSLDLRPLSAPAVELTEQLRGGSPDPERTEELYSAVKDAVEEIDGLIGQM